MKQSRTQDLFFAKPLEAFKQVRQEVKERRSQKRRKLEILSVKMKARKRRKVKIKTVIMMVMGTLIQLMRKVRKKARRVMKKN